MKFKTLRPLTASREEGRENTMRVRLSLSSSCLRNLANTFIRNLLVSENRALDGTGGSTVGSVNRDQERPIIRPGLAVFGRDASVAICRSF